MFQRKKSFFLFLVLLLAILSLLSACSSDKTTTKVNETSTSSDKKVRLVIWSHQEEGFIAANQKLIEQYKALHPNVEIDYQQFPYDVYNQKLKASTAGKNGPDISLIFGTWVPEYTKNGLLAEVPNGDEIKKNFYAAALGAYTMNDKIYGVPMEFNIENGGMLVHPKMFKDAGLAYPKTWAELVDTAKKLTVRDGDQIKIKGFDFASQDNVTFSLLSMILQQGGKYWGDNGHVNFSTPEAVKAMTALKNLVAIDKVTDLQNYTDTQFDISDYFFKGSSAMTYRGPWTIGNGLNTYKVNDFEYVPVPSFTDKSPLFAAESGWGFVVSKKSNHTSEAWAFVNYMAKDENLEAWNLGTKTIPPKKSVAEDPKYLQANPYAKTSLGVLQYGQWIGLLWDRDFFFKQVSDNFQLIATGKSTIEEGLKNLETSINQNQDQHK
jgi:multiple sugar transport system substrate-binding protein